MNRERVAAALPGYELQTEIGRGAWGVVLAAEHRQLGRRVAVKQLPEAFAANESVQKRFAVEARLLASLDHPHIVPIFDYVQDEGLSLLVMELLPGGTVRDRFATAGIGCQDACSIALSTCAALHYAHARGVLHRDIKPENLLFNASGTLKVTDFGIAKVLGGAETLVTQTGEVLGTPVYMAPEQVTAGNLSPATDVYAVATMLYELLSGQLPFSDEGGAIGVMFRHVYEEPTPLRAVAPHLSSPLADVVMSGIAADPASRPPTAEDFGLAVADAASQTWGPAWLTDSDLDVLVSPRVARRISNPSAQATPATVVAVPDWLAPSQPPLDDQATVAPTVAPLDSTAASATTHDDRVVPAAPPDGTPLDPTERLSAPPPGRGDAPPGQGFAPPPGQGFAPPPGRGDATPGRGDVPPTPGAPPSPRRRRRPLPLLAALGLLALATAATLIATRSTGGSSHKNATPTTTPGNTTATTATTATTGGSSKTLFRDDFTDSASGWAADANQDGNGTAAYRSDGYYLTVLKPNPVLNTFSAGSPYHARQTSLTVTVRATFVNAQGADAAGVRCDQGARTGLRYTFQVARDGTWVMFKLGDTGAASLASGTVPATASGSYDLSGECQELPNGATRLSMAVDGRPVATVEDNHGGDPIAWHAALTAYRNMASPATVVRFNSFQTTLPQSS